MTLSERFWSKVNKTGTGCWEWAAAVKVDGYGTFKYRRLASNASYHRRKEVPCAF